MNNRERYLAVYDEKERKKLDRVPTHVQYIRQEFIDANKERILKDYKGILFNDLYYDIPLILGFDSIFASFPRSVKIKSVKVEDGNGNIIRIGEDGEAIQQKTAYYEGGYIKNLEILNELEANLKILDNNMLIKKTISRYEKLSPYIFTVLQLEGIFDRVWKSMGMSTFSYHYSKNTNLYRELIKFYADLAQINLEGLINATGKRGDVITLLDDVAYKGRLMISPERWEQDFMPYYVKINSLISDAGMISQIHTDGDPTDLIPSLIKAGFRGLQGFEGGCDPIYINEKFPDFVVVGFGDVSSTLPFGTLEQIELHVKTLLETFKENRHFILGPSTVVFKEIPLQNIRKFIEVAKYYGKYD